MQTQEKWFQVLGTYFRVSYGSECYAREVGYFYGQLTMQAISNIIYVHTHYQIYKLIHVKAKIQFLGPDNFK